MSWGGTQPTYRRDFTGKLTLHRIHLDSQGYTRSGWVGAGQYFGTGAPLFVVEDEEGEVYFFIRARDLAAGKAIVRADYPNARGIGNALGRHRSAKRSYR